MDLAAKVHPVEKCHHLNLTPKLPQFWSECTRIYRYFFLLFNAFVLRLDLTSALQNITKQLQLMENILLTQQHLIRGALTHISQVLKHS